MIAASTHLPIPTRRFRFTLALLAMMITSANGDDFVWENNNANTNWNSAANWGGTLFEFPDDNTDSATISVPSVLISPRLNASNITIGALTIDSNGDVNTGDGTDNFGLTVQQSLFHDGSTVIEDAGSSLTVWQSPVLNDFDTDSLRIDAGTLILRQGAKTQVDGPLNIVNGGDIFGSGIVEMNSANGAVNDGLIRAAFGGTLTLRRTGTSQFDPDGAGNGELEASNNSTLVIDMPLADTDFDGTISIGQNAEVRINDQWTLDNSAGTRVDFHGDSETATLAGTGANLNGEIHVHSGTARWAAPINVGATANLTMSDHTTLQFDAPTTFANPDSIDNAFATEFIVNDVVNIGNGSGNFDWDGESQNLVLEGRTTVNPGGVLNIDVDRLDAPAFDERVSTRVVMNSGRIDVRVGDGQFEFDGSMRMNNTTGSMSRITGDEMLFTGRLTVGGTGESRISTRTIFGGASNVTVLAGAELEIGSGQSVINGGTWTGSGAVNLDSNLTRFTAPTIVDMPTGTFDMDGNFVGHTVAIDQPLTLNVASVDDNDNNRIDDVLQINGAAGRLNVNLTAASFYRIQGDLQLNGPGGGFVGNHLAGDDVYLEGTTTVSGNSMSTARVDLRGSMEIAGLNSTFNMGGGSSSNPNFIRQSATFSGAGRLINLNGTGLVAEDGVFADIVLENRGRMELGNASTANVSVSRFFQTNAGEIEFEIAAAPGVSQDRLSVAGIASLDGELVVSATNNFVPSVGDVYTLISAGPVAGTFDTLTTVSDGIVSFDANALYSANHVRIAITDVSILGDFNGDLALDCADVDALVAELASNGMSLVFDVNSDAMVDHQDLDEWLTIAGEFNIGGAYLPGDANLDGFVDVSDFGIWNQHKFSADNGWCGADFNADGVTDVSDFGIWNTNKFTASNKVAAVPEPGAGMLCLVGCISLVRISRRKP